MNADLFRYLFDYHFSENRRIWDEYVAQLSEAQFSQVSGYSHGSVRDQLVHMISVDETWFSGLRGEEIPEPLDPASFPDRASLRAAWERIEQGLRAYLADLHDAQLDDLPLEGEDEDLYVWQVLFQVINHGTDHRAQLLRELHDLGLKTSSQDFIFYVYEHLI